MEVGGATIEPIEEATDEGGNLEYNNEEAGNNNEITNNCKEC